MPRLLLFLLMSRANLNDQYPYQGQFRTISRLIIDDTNVPKSDLFSSFLCVFTELYSQFCSSALLKTAKSSHSAFVHIQLKISVC